MPKQGELDLYAKPKNVKKGRIYVGYDFFNRYITPRVGQMMGMTQHKRERMCSFPIRRVREVLSYNGFSEYARRVLAHANLSFPERSDLTPHFEAALGFISEQYQPRPYQVEAVRKMIEVYNKGKWGFILGDEPGTGKTIQAIMLAFAMFRMHYRMGRKDQWCILIVVPAALRDNFMREIYKADNGRGMIKFVVKDKVESAKICVISYNKATQIAKSFDERMMHIPLLVLDEVHYVKNQKSERSKAVQVLAEYTDFVLGMSGTIAKNRPAETYIPLLVTGIIKDLPYKRFVLMNEGGIHRTKYFFYVNNQKAKRFWSWLSSHEQYLRRLKKDVIEFLPEKHREVVALTVSDEDALRAMKRECELLEAYVRGEVGEWELWQAVSQYRRIVGLGKVVPAADFIEGLDMDKLVVMVHHNEVAEGLAERLRPLYDRVDVLVGSTSRSKRSEAVQAFQEGEGRHLLILSYGVGGEGLTLTAADTMVLVELDWTPATMLQAEDRIHRFGQRNACMYYYLVADSGDEAITTLDKYIVNVLSAKTKIVDIDWKGISS